MPIVLTISKARQRLLLIALGCIISAALAAALNLVLSQRALTESAGGGDYQVNLSSGFPTYAFGLYNREHTSSGVDFTWTTGHATIPFDYAANLGRHAHIIIGMAASRPPGVSAPTVIVTINGHRYPAFVPAQGYQVYSYELDLADTPGLYMHPTDLQVDIQSDTFSPPADPRQLGVALSTVQIEFKKDTLEAAVAVVVWALSTLLVLFIASRRLSLSATAIYGAAMLVSFVLLHRTYLPRAINQPEEIALAALAWLLVVSLTPQRRPLLGLIMAGALLWVVGAGGRWPWWGDLEIDDAFISYRYAWNLLHGNGLVYNPGVPVEGYTNFLWTLLIAAALALGWQPTAVALFLNIALTVGLITLTYYLARKLIISEGWKEPGALAAVIFLAFDRTLVTYGVRGSGMESLLFAFLLLLAVTLLWSSAAEHITTITTSKDLLLRAVAGILLALAALTRPEGVLVAGVLLTVRAWQDSRRGGSQWKNLAAAVIAMGAILLPYETWRISFYGYPFPNTFYAKTGLSAALIGRGVSYAWEFTIAHWLIALLAVCSLLILGTTFVRAAFARSRREATPNTVYPGPIPPTTAHPNPNAQPQPATASITGISNSTANVSAALAWLVGIYALYIISVGGDWLTADRFFVPLVAPLALLAVATACRLLASLRLPRIASRAVPALLLVLALAYTATSLAELGQKSRVTLRSLSDEYNTRWWAAVGFWLRQNTPPTTLVAVQGAGAVAYYGQRPVLDMYGLTDIHIAHLQVADMGAAKAGHEKKDPEYVLNSRPNYILREWDAYFGDTMPEVLNLYTPEMVDTPTGWPLSLLKRKATAGP